jgi:RimJ/RimL family protein N-acetyltransferase
MATTPPPTPSVPERVETARLVLRPYGPEDGTALFAAVQESLHEIAPWLPWADKHPDVEASTETCVRLREGFLARQDFTMGMFDRRDDRLLGGTGLHRVRWEIPAFEIGYWLRTSAVGHGYVTEAAAALTRLCFESLGAQRVEIVLDPTNARSAAVPERLGFVLEGTLRRALIGVDGRPRDRRVYGFVREDWERERERIARLADRPEAR